MTLFHERWGQYRGQYVQRFNRYITDYLVFFCFAAFIRSSKVKSLEAHMLFKQKKELPIMCVKKISNKIMFYNLLRLFTQNKRIVIAHSSNFDKFPNLDETRVLLLNPSGTYFYAMMWFYWKRSILKNEYYLFLNCIYKIVSYVSVNDEIFGCEYRMWSNFFLPRILKPRIRAFIVHHYSLCFL